MTRDCPACLKLVSARANDCPRCGHPLRRQRGVGRLIALVVVVAASFLFVLSLVQAGARANKRQNDVLVEEGRVLDERRLEAARQRAEDRMNAVTGR